LVLLCSQLLFHVAAGQQGEQPELPAASRASRVRLPAYFAGVVTPAQREEVYKIQLLYVKQIEALQQQIRELELKRDAEVDGVLTPEQLAEIQKRREVAAARRRQQEAAAGNPAPPAANEDADQR
jgi:hypothetical protein